MKVVIVVTKGNAVLAVWGARSGEGNQAAIEQAAAMAAKAGQDIWDARRSLTERGFTEVGDYRITVAERRTGRTNVVPDLDD